MRSYASLIDGTLENVIIVRVLRWLAEIFLNALWPNSTSSVGAPSSCSRADLAHLYTRSFEEGEGSFKESPTNFLGKGLMRSDLSISFDSLLLFSIIVFRIIDYPLRSFFFFFAEGQGSDFLWSRPSRRSVRGQ